jgi:hypothetical protein
MRLRKTLVIALVLLPGCSSPEDSQRRVIGNGAYVSIFNVPNEKDATPFGSAIVSGTGSLLGSGR